MTRNRSRRPQYYAEDQGYRDEAERPAHGGYTSRMDYLYNNEQQDPQDYYQYGRSDPMQSLHDEGTLEYSGFSSQYPRSTWEDFPDQYGRPISPDSRRAKTGTRERDDADLRRYKREPSAPPPAGQSEGENWREAAERFGLKETLGVLNDVMKGRMHRHEMNAYAALRLLAACRGYEISDEMASEQLEDMVDQLIEEEARRKGRMGEGGYGRRREGYDGHYGWYQN